MALDNDLDAVAKPLFAEHGTEKPISIENYLVETNIDCANKWMAAIHNVSHECCESSIDESTSEYDLPATILVCTKPDVIELDKEKIIQKAVDKILDTFDSYGCGSHIVKTFIIDNTKFEDAEIHRLRETIFFTCQDILRKKNEIPINWLRLEMYLAFIMKSKPYITYEELEELGKSVRVNETLPQAVRFLHEQNVVFHFPDSGSASSLVVLNLEWLMKTFTSVINVPPNSEKSPNIRKFWKCLSDRGQLSKKLLRHLLKDHGKHVEALIGMMEMVNLICRWDDEIWLVPSMAIPKRRKEELGKLLKACCLPSLYLEFDGGYIPLGLFTRLQVILFRMYRILFREPPSLSCHSSIFDVEAGDLVYCIILAQHLSRIQIALCEETSPIPQDLVVEIALKLKSSLCEAIEEIRPTSPVYKGLKYQFAVKCKCGLKKFEKCPRHQLSDCSSEDCTPLVLIGNSTPRCSLCQHLLDDKITTPWIKRDGKYFTCVACTC